MVKLPSNIFVHKKCPGTTKKHNTMPPTCEECHANLARVFDLGGIAVMDVKL